MKPNAASPSPAHPPGTPKRLLNAAVGRMLKGQAALFSRERASKQITRFARIYVELGHSLNDAQGSAPIECRKMLGIDEDMRRWSFFQLVEHNTIVNEFYRLTIRKLMGAPVDGSLEDFDTKHDVMPSDQVGASELDRFEQGLEAYLTDVNAFGDLRHSATSEHPLFGPLNAHQFHCLCGVHLKTHLRQARQVARRARRL